MPYGSRTLSEEELLAAARDVRERAYAPYSNFKVGAAIRAEDGTVYAGCNVENAAYPTSLCAERSALVSAISAGRRRFDVIAIVATPHEQTPAAPCGACRQALAEFGLDLYVILAGPNDTDPRLDTTLRALLPHAFTPESL